jgi:hypothetical protein
MCLALLYFSYCNTQELSMGQQHYVYITHFTIQYFTFMAVKIHTVILWDMALCCVISTDVAEENTVYL